MTLNMARCGAIRLNYRGNPTHRRQIMHRSSLWFLEKHPG